MRVKRVTHYDNVEKALATEDIARLQPGKTVKEILAALHSRLATMGESKNNGDWKRRSVTVIELENSS